MRNLERCILHHVTFELMNVFFYGKDALHSNNIYPLKEQDLAKMLYAEVKSVPTGAVNFFHLSSMTREM